MAVFVGEGRRTREGYAKARVDADKKYRLIKAIADDNPGRAALAYSPEDVRRISTRGKFAVVISLRNGYPLAFDINQLVEWYQRSVRGLG
jgi:microsomal dipeptidase-like Zn-dependent dipeptidase